MGGSGRYVPAAGQFQTALSHSFSFNVTFRASAALAHWGLMSRNQ